MDIMEKTTKPRKHRWTIVEIGLSVILLLMSCALAGLVVLYASARKGGTASMAQAILMYKGAEKCVTNVPL